MTTFKMPAEKTEDGYSFSFDLMTPEEISISNLLLRNQIESQDIKMDALAEKIDDLLQKQPEDVVHARIRRLEESKKRVHETLRSRK